MVSRVKFGAHSGVKMDAKLEALKCCINPYAWEGKSGV